MYSGQVTSLTFVNDNEGVGFVLLANDANAMIMTFDGGRHWSSITF